MWGVSLLCSPSKLWTNSICRPPQPNLPIFCPLTASITASYGKRRSSPLPSTRFSTAVLKYIILMLINPAQRERIWCSRCGKQVGQSLPWAALRFVGNPCGIFTGRERIVFSGGWCWLPILVFGIQCSIGMILLCIVESCEAACCYDWLIVWSCAYVLLVLLTDADFLPFGADFCCWFGKT